MVVLIPAPPVVESEYPRLRLTGMMVEEFGVYARLPEHGDSMFEYIQEEVIEVVSSGKSSELGVLFAILIGSFARLHKLGWITGADRGYMINGERYIPDVAFKSFARQPKPSRAAYKPSKSTSRIKHRLSSMQTIL